MISIIAAAAANGVIGANGGIPWDVPEDRAYFKRLTSGGAVIMGRRTFESIGRPLPERMNIVISSGGRLRGKMLRTAQSLDEGIEIAGKWLRKERTEGGIFLCGGAEIYRQGLEKAERIYLTELYDEYEGDVYFPEFSREKFRLISCDDRPELRLRFCVYEKD